MDAYDVPVSTLVTTMKADLHGIKELKKVSYRNYCLMLDNNYYLDAAEMCNENNFGAQINDCFNAEGYNVYGEGLKMKDGTWVPIIMGAHHPNLCYEIH